MDMDPEYCVLKSAVKKLKKSLSKDQFSICKRWLIKLKKYPDKDVRNTYIVRMQFEIKSGYLCPPFSSYPPIGNLDTLPPSHTHDSSRSSSTDWSLSSVENSIEVYNSDLDPMLNHNEAHILVVEKRSKSEPNLSMHKNSVPRVSTPANYTQKEDIKQIKIGQKVSNIEEIKKVETSENDLDSSSISPVEKFTDLMLENFINQKKELSANSLDPISCCQNVNNMKYPQAENKNIFLQNSDEKNNTDDSGFQEDSFETHKANIISKVSPSRQVLQVQKEFHNDKLQVKANFERVKTKENIPEEKDRKSKRIIIEEDCKNEVNEERVNTFYFPVQEVLRNRKEENSVNHSNSNLVSVPKDENRNTQNIVEKEKNSPHTNELILNNSSSETKTSEDIEIKLKILSIEKNSLIALNGKYENEIKRLHGDINKLNSKIFQMKKEREICNRGDVENNRQENFENYKLQCGAYIEHVADICTREYEKKIQHITDKLTELLEKSNLQNEKLNSMNIKFNLIRNDYELERKEMMIKFKSIDSLHQKILTELIKRQISEAQEFQSLVDHYREQFNEKNAEILRMKTNMCEKCLKKEFVDENADGGHQKDEETKHEVAQNNTRKYINEEVLNLRQINKELVYFYENKIKKIMNEKYLENKMFNALVKAQKEEIEMYMMCEKHQELRQLAEDLESQYGTIVNEAIRKSKSQHKEDVKKITELETKLSKLSTSKL